MLRHKHSYKHSYRHSFQPPSSITITSPVTRNTFLARKYTVDMRNRPNRGFVAFILGMGVGYGLYKFFH